MHTNICPGFCVSAVRYRPCVVLEHLPRVCEETRPELRSLRISGGRVRQILSCFTAAFLYRDQGMGRRHVGPDATEEGQRI